MKNITAIQRKLNILEKATQNDFEIDESESFDELIFSAEQYLIDNEIDAQEEECEVVSLGNHGQRIDWYDGKGYEFWAQGEIIDFSHYWNNAPEEKVYHTTVVDSEANVVKLFYFVGETEYNAPDGYYYSKK